ncbi:MAG: signal recognition particle-docking protein FtsY [Pseudomonadota bacterium]|nr:signal recognition particle-docking protein FtsY [Gammaproteobacteria bacterium]MBU1559041.1 signal recognition particle-docking protein FtsY [Gammaproteobacteria bacterium]MBU1926981.1 signal recognition particle-docking protein FtsY [Gammaproteobacteria bacterium]MBU2546126.1 signal recognition particle-docking protein FtsY [Gammaproteobacteria bacterium]
MIKIFKRKNKTQETEPVSVFDKLKTGLRSTRKVLTTPLSDLLLGKKTIDQDLLDEIETYLLTADVGVSVTEALIQKLTKQLKAKQLNDEAVLLNSVRSYLESLLKDVEKPLHIPAQQKPFVILTVGVNGSGKTTTIGKMIKVLQNEGKTVLLAAGDTFRAAAIDQLKVWGERNNVPVVAQQPGSDSASVIYDAFNSAKARGVDVLIADTAGRLHTQSHLMEELKKIKKVLTKIDESAPHEVMLVIDATLGQNSLQQAKQFHEAVGVTGIALTKLDGTAKGGIIFAIAKELGIPIRFIGVGEKVDDLRVFNASDFVKALFE